MILKTLEAWTQKLGDAQRRWRWLGRALTAASVIYILALLLFGNLHLNEIQWSAYWRPSLAAMFFYLASLMAQYIVWARMVSFFHKTGWLDMAIYSRVLLLRRLPGGIWHWVGRTAMYSGSTRVPARAVLLANFLEWILLLLIAGAVILAGLVSLTPIFRILLPATLLAIAMALAYIWQPASRSSLLRLAEGSFWLVMYGFSWLMGGLIVYFLAMAAETTSGGSSISLLRAAWIWSVSGGSSLLLVIVPSGLGIREVTLTWLMNPYISTAAALLIAILIRVIFIAADVLWGTLGVAISMRFLSPDPLNETPAHPAGKS